MSCAKAFLFFLNTVFLGLSGLFIYVAVWLIQSYRDYYKLTTDTYTVVPAGIIIAVGIFVLITAVCGCCGIFRNSKCCLGTFSVLLVLVLAMEITAGVFGAVYKNQAKHDVKEGLDEAIRHYNHSGYGPDKALDFIQKKLKCCGDTNFTDYYNSPYYKKYKKFPDSCFSKPPHNPFAIPYRKGCYESLLSKFDEYMTYIIGIGIGFAVLQLFGMVAACWVMCKSSDVAYVTLNGGTFV